MAANVPMSALFELTGRCNLDCGHCYLDIRHPPSEMSTAEAMYVVDQLAEAGTLFLTLTGGEILLRKDTLEIAAHARRRGMALRLFTNATRVTPSIAGEIARIRPLAVEVSIYGSSRGVHDKVTRRRALRRTLRGVLRLKRAGVRVGLKAPLLAPVAGEIDRLFDLAERIGAPMMFDPFVTPRHDGHSAPLDLRADTAALAAALADPRLGLKKQLGLPQPRQPDDVPCAIARRTTRIAPNGDVYPCPTYPTPIGNMLERPFAELWASGPLLNRLRAVRVRDLLGDCAGCPQSGYCGRCSAVALLEHGDELGPARESCRIAEAKERALGLPGRGAPYDLDEIRLPVIG